MELNSIYLLVTYIIFLLYTYLYMYIVRNYREHLLSLSVMVTLASAKRPIVTPLGKNKGSRARVNISFPSSRLSLVIETTKNAVVSPAGNVTVYGPDP